jgi:phosphatidylserine decarboxylase
MDAGGTSDPYCIIYYGQYKFQTQTVDKDLFPQWLEETTWAALPNTDLSCFVFDQDKISKDDSMGQFQINSKTLHDGALHDEWFKLPKGGQVRLRWRYMPHVNNIAAAPSLIQSKKHAFVQKLSPGRLGDSWDNCWAELRDEFLLLSTNPGVRNQR